MNNSIVKQGINIRIGVLCPIFDLLVMASNLVFGLLSPICCSHGHGFRPWISHPSKQRLVQNLNSPNFLLACDQPGAFVMNLNLNESATHNKSPNLAYARTILPLL